MTALVILAVLVLAGVGIWLYRGHAARAYSVAELLELGRIEVPDRLANRGAMERAERVIFRFDRIADSFLMIGSLTPIRERLVLLAWPDGAGAGSDEPVLREFRAFAAERVQKPQWRREDAFEIAEGMHEVNNNWNESWVLLYRLPGEKLLLGYRVWRKDATLDQAKATVRRVAGSFVRAATQEAFFTAVVERPEKEAQAGRAALIQALAARGVQIELDGPLIEAANNFYILQVEGPPIEGAWFTIFHPIGSMPAVPGRLRPLWSHERAKWLMNWPVIMFFRHGPEGWVDEWCNVAYDVPPALAALLAPRHTDSGRVYFYIVYGLRVDTTPPDRSDLDHFFRTIPEMERIFALGDFIQQLD